MKRSIIRGLAAVVCTLMFCLTVIAGRPVLAAQEDVVLNDAGSPLIRVIDPGDGDGYTYMGYVYCGEGIGPEYKYLKLTYKGDETAFSQLRIEILNGSDAKIGVFWFSENAEGSFRTSDGALLPAPSAEEQTVVVDMEASGIDVSGGIHAMHIHDTQGIGKVIITDARLMTTPEGTPAFDTVEKPEAEASVGATVETAQPEPAVKAADGPVVNTAEGNAPKEAALTPAGSTEPAEEQQDGGSHLVPWLVCCGGVVFVGACVAARIIYERKH